MNWIMIILFSRCSCFAHSRFESNKTHQYVRKHQSRITVSATTSKQFKSSNSNPTIRRLGPKSLKTKSIKKSPKHLCNSSGKSMKSSNKKGKKSSKSFKKVNCDKNDQITNPAPAPVNHRTRASRAPSLFLQAYDCTNPVARKNDINSVVASISSVIEPMSPEDLALSWLLNNDTETNACGGLDRIIQRYILAVFYFSTNGSDWKNKNKWLLRDNECTWYGVTCSGGIVVTSLFMDENNLDGTIPTEVAILRSLSELHIYSNNIGGTLPTELGSLTKLTLLDLEVNGLEGQLFFPELESTAGTLKYLYGSNNKFEGSIPSWIGNLKALQELFAADNTLTGSIPTEISQLTDLASLILYENKLTGTIPMNIGSLSKMQVMDLSNNNLNGCIPSSIDSMQSLVRLVLQSDNLVGTIPESIGSFLNLTKINLSKNYLTGTIPAGFSSLEKLETVIFDSNSLHGNLPDYRSPALLYVNIARNTLTGSLPSNLFKLPLLKYLYLSNNTFSGSIPTAFSESTSLSMIWLDGNKLTGNVPIVSVPNGWPKIREVLLEHNLLVGSIPSSICNIRSMKPLRFSSLHTDCAPPTVGLGQAQISCPNGCCTACYVGALV